MDLPKERGETRSQPFTLKEIQGALKAAEGSEWYGMTLVGIHPGARLTDWARLT